MFHLSGTSPWGVPLRGAVPPTFARQRETMSEVHGEPNYPRAPVGAGKFKVNAARTRRPPSVRARRVERSPSFLALHNV